MPALDFQKAKQIIKQAMKRGGNMADNYMSMAKEDFKLGWDLTDQEAQEIYSLVKGPWANGNF